MSENLGKGWTAEVFESEAQGRSLPLHWVCKDVKHDDFSFAKEIFINKVIVTLTNKSVVELTHNDFEWFGVGDILEGDTETVKPEYQKLFKYGSERDDELMNVRREKNTDNTYSNYLLFNRHNFNSYAVSGSVFSFKCKKFVTSTQKHPLFVFSSFSVGSYGNDPPHEFSGGLEAARLMPSIWFATEDPGIASIRIDYRFHLHTDDNIPLAEAFGSGKTIMKWESSQNFASIIRDDDHLVIFSCFNEFLSKASDFVMTKALFTKKLAEYFILVDDVFVKARITKLPELVAVGTELLNLAIQLEVLVIGLIAEMLINIPACLINDTSQSIKNILEVLSEEGKLLQDKIWPVIQGAIQIFKNVLAILGTMTVDALDEVNTIITIAVLPFLTPIIYRRRLERKEATKKAIADLLMENRKLTAKLKTDFWIMVDQFVFVAGKIFTFVAFEACEKPVQFEMSGYFIDKGMVDATWDNLHWWGTNFVPSAPGAFHAIHQHFRWARYLGNPSASETLGNRLLFYILGGKSKPISDEAGTAPFRSLVAAFSDSKLGGPLIDPRLSNQTIQFALALNGGDFDKALLAIDSKKSFEDIAKAQGDAKRIATELTQTGNEEKFTGSDIVYWLSLKAHREDFAKPFRGTLLINGFYFAHDREPEASFLGDTPTSFSAITKGTSSYRPAYTSPVKVFREPK